jgi:hypothetical protein
MHTTVGVNGRMVDVTVTVTPPAGPPEAPRFVTGRVHLYCQGCGRRTNERDRFGLCAGCRR